MSIVKTNIVIINMNISKCIFDYGFDPSLPLPNLQTATIWQTEASGTSLVISPGHFNSTYSI